MGKGKAKTAAAAPAQGGPPYPEEQQQHGAAAGAVVTEVTEIFGEEPTKTTCPNCKQQVLTNVKLVNGAFAWMVALIAGFFCCGIGCCIVLFCVDACKDAEHYCPQCNAICGKNRRC